MDSRGGGGLGPGCFALVVPHPRTSLRWGAWRRLMDYIESYDLPLTMPPKELGMKIQAILFANPGQIFSMQRGGSGFDRIIIQVK